MHELPAAVFVRADGGDAPEGAGEMLTGSA
jgi:hypothetical protein